MLINCLECNEYISETAQACPQCGYDFKNNPKVKELAKARRIREIKENSKKCGCLSILLLALVLGGLIKLVF